MPRRSQLYDHLGKCLKQRKNKCKGPEVSMNHCWRMALARGWAVVGDNRWGRDQVLEDVMGTWWGFTLDYKYTSLRCKLLDDMV
jgi:hypothetical protein